jgi:uncharacterized membrane protein YiaA
MAFFEWLEYSALADWIGTSAWGYPILLTAHSVGLAIIVGIFFVLNLRILGLFSQVSIVSLSALIKLSWCGFALNLASGLGLFISQATFFATHLPFLVKITAILLALVSAAYIQRVIKAKGEQWDTENQIPNRAKLLAIISISLWLTAIIAGRLIAYID